MADSLKDRILIGQIRPKGRKSKMAGLFSYGMLTIHPNLAYIQAEGQLVFSDYPQLTHRKLNPGRFKKKKQNNKAFNLQRTVFSN